MVKGISTVARLVRPVDRGTEMAIAPQDVTDHNGDRPIRILVADGNAFIRDAIRRSLANDGRIEVVGEASTAAEIIWAVRTTAPNVVVLDYRLPDAEAPDIIGRLRERSNAPEFVVLSSVSGAREVRSALQSGARSFLTKRSATVADLTEAIRDASEGVDRVTDDALAALLSSVRRGSKERYETITPRAREVWRLIALGKTNAEIAGLLFVTERTVKYHVGMLLERTGTRSRAELVAVAYQQGVMDADL